MDEEQVIGVVKMIIAIISLITTIAICLSGMGIFDKVGKSEYCIVPGCPSEASVYSDYCYSHKCVNSKCKNKRAGSLFCKVCIQRAN